jgi:hypothetical protein
MWILGDQFIWIGTIHLDWDRRQLFCHLSSSALLQIKNATNVFVGNFTARVDVADPSAVARNR